MRGGALRHRVTLQQRSTDQDETGAQADTWTDFAPVWASVEPLTGRELYNAQQIKPEVTTTITIRYLAGVTAAMRVLFEGLVYDIEAVIDPEKRHRKLQLLCKGGLNNG